MEVEKIDLSLDDIIKLNRKEKKLSAKGVRGQGQQGKGRGGRGRGSQRGGGGNQRGGGGNQRGLGRGSQRSGRGTQRGRGRGSQRGSGGIQGGLRKGLLRGGSSQRGRGRGAQRRGTQQGLKGRGLNKLRQFRTNLNTGSTRGGRGSKGVSPLNRNGLFTKKNSMQKLQGAERSLLVQKSQALKALQQAKRTLAQLNAQTRSSTNRQNLVNQRRGLQNKFNNMQAQPQQRQRLNRNFGSSSVRNGGRRGKRRQWRAQNTTRDSDGMLTVHVNNTMPQGQKKKKNKINRTGLNFPTSPTQTPTPKFNIQKKHFASNTTGVSLSERFSGSGDGMAGRRVFY